MKQLKPLSNLIHTFAAMYKVLKHGWNPRPTLEPSMPFRGEPVLRLDQHGQTRCTVCQTCVHTCPTQCLRVTRDGEQPSLELDWGRCMYCGLCVRACPVDALGLSSDVRILDRRDA